MMLFASDLANYLNMITVCNGLSVFSDVNSLMIGLTLDKEMTIE